MLSGYPKMAAGNEDKRETGGKPNENAVTLSTKSVSLPTNITELLWEEKQRSLRELVSNYRLPLAVKLRKGDSSLFEKLDDENTSAISDVLTGALRITNSTHNEYRKQSTSSSTKSNDSINSGRDHEDTILQLHEIRRKKIILARKMTFEKRQNDYVVTGEQVEIPASFRGWLEVVPDDGRPVEYFDTVAGITSVKPRRFLVRTSTVGYQLNTEENGNSCWMPNEIKPGEVLTTGIVYMDNKKNKNSSQRNIFKRLLKQNKSKSKDQDLKYLQCFDSGGHEIMIPLIMSGVFSPVGDASIANYDAVYELQDLIMAFGLPVNAQLIHSNNKEEFRCPKGVLRLYGTREEELVVVSRVKSDGVLFSDSSNLEGAKLEIPIDKDLFFSRGVVKKKPSIKAKLVDVFPPQNDKDTVHMNRSEDGDRKEYSRSNSAAENEYKLRHTYDRRMSTPLTNQSRPLTSFGNPLAASVRSRDPQHLFSQTNYPTQSPALANISQSNPTTPSYTTLNGNEQTHTKEQIYQKDPTTSVELPERVPPKELKKSRSTGLLDKLSVRKVKKERAKLKELRSDDVFSKRIVRQDLSYQEFFNGLGDEEDEEKTSSENKVSKYNNHGAANQYPNYTDNIPPHGANDINMDTSNDVYRKPGAADSVSASAFQRKKSIQHRDLPPIPPESPHHSDSSSSFHHETINSSKDSLYEHLPPAPTPPRTRDTSKFDTSKFSYSHGEFDEEDGYMMPIQLQEQKALYTQPGVRLRNKPPASRESYRDSRARKVRSEIHPNSKISPHNDGCPIDIDGLFSFAYNSKDLGENRPLGTLGGHAATSTSQLYGYAPKNDYVPAWTSDISGNAFDLEQRFMDNLDLQTRSNTPGFRNRNRPSRAMNANPNATIRSHNLRKMQQQQQLTAMELFHFTDSFRDLRDHDGKTPEHSRMINNNPAQYYPTMYDESNNNSDNNYPPLPNSRPPLLNSRSVDATTHHNQAQNIYGPTGYGYPESEPCYRPNSRQLSMGGPYEPIYVKHGDDSAISLCSRGEGGFHNESEYSYNEHSDYYDDGWTPADQVEGMTVQEVSKSLRYIGMKDRVVLRFSNEQIDGSMLCTLDKKLLKEGFPELNALEMKKILDFVQGWRPKKS